MRTFNIVKKQKDMTYEEFKNKVLEYEHKMEEADKVLKSFPRGSMGLTPDHIKQEPAYQLAKQKYNKYFDLLRNLNKANKDHVKTAANERRTKRLNNLNNI